MTIAPHAEQIHAAWRNMFDAEKDGREDIDWSEEFNPEDRFREIEESYRWVEEPFQEAGPADVTLEHVPPDDFLPTPFIWLPRKASPRAPGSMGCTSDEATCRALLAPAGLPSRRTTSLTRLP